MTNYLKLLVQTQANLAYLAGPSYAERVIETACENVNVEGAMPDNVFYREAYLNIGGVLEALDAPESHFSCIA